MTLEITSNKLPHAVVGEPYAASIGVAGGVPPYTVRAIDIPPGFAFNPTNGDLTEARGGAVRFWPARTSITFVATDSAGEEVRKSLTLTVDQTRLADPLPHVPEWKKKQRRERQARARAEAEAEAKQKPAPQPA